VLRLRNLGFSGWYLEDGNLILDEGGVNHLIELLMGEEVKSMGLHLNLKKILFLLI
jgi:hypothetical protein